MVTQPGEIDRRKAVIFTQGTTFNWPLSFKTTAGVAIDFTGARFMASIYDASGKEVLTFDSNASPATIDMPTPTNGSITLTQSASTMASQTWTEGTLLLKQIGPNLDTSGQLVVTAWLRAYVILRPQNYQAA